MKRAGGERRDPAKPRRTGVLGLAVLVVAPTNDAAIRPECESVIASGGNGHYIAQTRRSIALTFAVVARGDYRTVGPKAQDEPVTNGDRSDIRRSREKTFGDCSAIRF